MVEDSPKNERELVVGQREVNERDANPNAKSSRHSQELCGERSFGGGAKNERSRSLQKVNFWPVFLPGQPSTVLLHVINIQRYIKTELLSYYILFGYKTYDLTHFWLDSGSGRRCRLALPRPPCHHRFLLCSAHSSCRLVDTSTIGSRVQFV